MTESIPATPGWVDEKLDEIFARLPEATSSARDEFASCLAAEKVPARPSDLLGAEFEPCHAALRRALIGAGVDRAVLDGVMADVEALEAEISAES
jgi:hypothetical protein